MFSIWRADSSRRIWNSGPARIGPLDDEVYGVSIAKAIEDSGREVVLGSVYVTLDRLEGKGLVRSSRR